MSKSNTLEKQNRGITIIALVVTIIVILILTGITLSSVGGENGLLKQIRNEKENVESKSNVVGNEIKGLEEKLVKDSPEV